MGILARTAVPAALAGLLLTGCGGGKTHSAGEIAAPPGATFGGAAPAGPASGGAAAIDATRGDIASASMGAPVNMVTPLAAAPTATATVDGRTITTRGVGRASGTPDTLTVLIGVSTKASSAKAALEANNAKANALIELLRRNGVASKDLRTRQLSINPTYDDKSTITGYQVYNAVQATLHDLTKAGTLLDAAVGVLGNAARIEHISFSIGDDSALRAQARSQAVAQAKTQAAELAQAAGVTLGRIRTLTEMVDAGSPISYDMQAAAGASKSPPLQAGQQELTVAVDLVYEIS
ncbi:MAG: SIMPL domain-containing protein [Jatrophihabitantaceae bacterium]